MYHYSSIFISVKYESLPNSCPKDSNNGDFGKQVFRPQPGVSIEHSPISTNSGKNQRKQKQQQTSNSTSKVDPLITVKRIKTEKLVKMSKLVAIFAGRNQYRTIHAVATKADKFTATNFATRTTTANVAQSIAALHNPRHCGAAKCYANCTSTFVALFIASDTTRTAHPTNYDVTSSVIVVAAD